MTGPRKPNEHEKSDLAFYVANEMGGWEANDHLERAHSLVEEAAIAVFEDYVSDSPSCTGKVMTVVWGVEPSMYEVFMWNKDELVRVNQEPEFAKTKETAL